MAKVVEAWTALLSLGRSRDGGTGAQLCPFRLCSINSSSIYSLVLKCSESLVVRFFGREHAFFSHLTWKLLKKKCIA
ncbi:hypothetical protein PVAP13_9NG533600 [Panicum virgatum]|uniref:Uncharacterized protein n=1 Tax=Panicum virgatum TaxID=38727 RepID=A0A8T0ML30_PANVG|nr:hypothetical protein PVAP13_9NG533600 [Panicum virgatum]